MKVTIVGKVLYCIVLSAVVQGSICTLQAQQFPLGNNAVSVMSFGAVGDGAHDDTSGIQAAVNSLSAAGGIVYFPPGNYRVSQTIQITTSTSMVGNHKKLCVLSAPSLNGPILNFAGQAGAPIQGIEVSNLTLYGASATGLSLTWVNKSEISDLWLYNLNDGIVADHSFSNRYTGISAYQVVNDSIRLLDECSQSVFTGNDLVGQHGLLIAGNNAALTITGNSFSRVYVAGIQLSPAAGKHVSGVIIEANYFEAVYGTGVMLSGTDKDSIRAIGVRNNYFSGGYSGYFGRSPSYAQTAITISETNAYQIHANEFLDWGTAGIASDGTSKNGTIAANVLISTPTLLITQ